jgi:hypothetical protein
MLEDGAGSHEDERCAIGASPRRLGGPGWVVELRPDVTEIVWGRGGMKSNDGLVITSTLLHRSSSSKNARSGGCPLPVSTVFRGGRSLRAATAPPWAPVDPSSYR